jgi:hypothetical protein
MQGLLALPIGVAWESPSPMAMTRHQMLLRVLGRQGLRRLLLRSLLGQSEQ